MERSEPELRAKSFRNEDYNNRRAFLRSYPLYDQDREDEDTKAAVAAASQYTERPEYGRNGGGSTLKRKPMQKIIVSVFHWGGETVLVFRRFKHKVTFFVITCLPSGLRARTALISV